MAKHSKLPRPNNSKAAENPRIYWKGYIQYQKRTVVVGGKSEESQSTRRLHFIR